MPQAIVFTGLGLAFIGFVLLLSTAMYIGYPTPRTKLINIIQIVGTILIAMPTLRAVVFFITN